MIPGRYMHEQMHDVDALHTLSGDMLENLPLVYLFTY